MSKIRPAKYISISILILIVILAVYLFLHSPFFKLDKVYASGMDKVSQSEILALAGIPTGKNIFSVNVDMVAKAVKYHPMIQEVAVIRHLPRQLEIKVKERQVWALVLYHNSFLCIDNTGIYMNRLSQFSTLDYPIITMDNVSERLDPGQAIEPEAIGIIKKIWDALGNDERQKISEFHFKNTSREVVIYTTRKTEVRFGNLDRLEEKIAFFKQVFQIENNIQKEGKEVLQYIDLRFAGEPVIKTKP